MKTVFHPADARGKAYHGWLKSRHSFSFAQYYDPERMGFGALRVLNDDEVAPGMGFDTHPHRDMEIVSIPLSGDLKHADSMGHSDVIREGDIQLMSAGTGILHSEYNASKEDPVQFLQIWVIPEKQGVKPRYERKSIRDLITPNEFTPLISPDQRDSGMFLHQNTTFFWGEFTESTQVKLALSAAKQGLYVFVVSGSAEIAEQPLGERDAMGIWETEELEIKAESGSRILAIEIPMQ
jgi:hypothetical protein